MTYTTADIRNIALVGGAGAGKTQLAEMLLHTAGCIAKPGNVQTTNTVSDFLDREKVAQHSLKPSICSFDYKERHINLLDTPGSVDFFGRSTSVLTAVESTALVLDATSSIDSYIRKIAQTTIDVRLCRMIVVNKIDAENVDLANVVDQIQSVLGKECLPINLPANGGTQVIDCFVNKDEGETDFDSVEDAHERIIDQVVELDEELMELYLEEGDNLPEERLHDAFEQALREGHLVPIFFTSAQTGVGIQELLDLVIQLMPNPHEGNEITFTRGTGEDATEISITTDAAERVIAHVFAVSIDPFKGRMGYCRVHQGTLNAGSSVFVDNERKPIKATHLLSILGGKQTEVESVVAGDICAIPRAEGIKYNSLLHESHDEDEVHFKPVQIPYPVYGLAVRPSDDNDAQKIADAMHTISTEDPSIAVEHITSLNETVLRGMGEMHLRVILEEIQEKYDVSVHTSIPSIDYRETITAPAEGHHRHKKQTGGAGQFGEVYLRIEPLERGKGFEFVDNVVGGVIPYQFVPAVEKGVLQVLDTGAISGHEMQDVRVSVYDGKHHPVDSKEIAFVQAGKKAFLDAVAKARPIVMEPVVSVRINVPSECMGDVAGDLSSMGGMVNGSNMQQDNTVEIQGQLPLRELQTYHPRLNSISGGKGSFAMEFSHYAAVQPLLQKELTSAFKPLVDE